MALAILWFLNQHTSFKFSLGSLQDVRPWQLACSVLLLYLGFILSTVRLRILIVQNTDKSVRLLPLFAINHLGSFLSLFQLSSLLPGLGKFVLISREIETIPKKLLAFSLILDKTYGIASFFLLAALLSPSIPFYAPLIGIPLAIGMGNKTYTMVNSRLKRKIPLKLEISPTALGFSIMSLLINIAAFATLVGDKIITIGLGSFIHKITIGLLTTFTPFTFNGAGVSHLSFERLFANTGIDGMVLFNNFFIAYFCFQALGIISYALKRNTL